MSTTSVRISEELVSRVRDESEKNKQSIGGYIELAVEDKLAGGIIGKIKSDSSLFEAYQANIAMAIYDEFGRYRKKHNKRTLSMQDIHKIANQGAVNFLNLLIK